MVNSAYSLAMPSWLLGHGPGSIQLLRDGVLSGREELTAQVRSGDYFATLATLLDSISGTLTEGNEAESMILQHLVDNLLYLDHVYKLVEK